MRAILYGDGAAAPQNPGIGSYGYVLIDPDAKKVIRTGKGVIGNNISNNIAEYTACLQGVLTAVELGVTRILIRSDSQLMIKQLTGEFACNKENLMELRDFIREVLEPFESVVYQWVPRDQNTRADVLANEAYREYCEANKLPVKYFVRPGGKK